jgi:hypothetical protein
MIKFGKEKVKELYPNARCEAILPYRFANSPKHVQLREAVFSVSMGEDHPQVSGKRFVGFTAMQAWKSAAKWVDNPTYN